MEETPQQRYFREHGKANAYPEPGAIDHRPIKAGRMGDLPAARPCVECPLARASIRGRLGGYSVGQYLDILHASPDIACHLSPGFPHVLETQRSCTGVAMYRANCGITVTGHAQDAVERVGANRDLCFASPREFSQHHQPLGAK